MKSIEKTHDLVGNCWVMKPELAVKYRACIKKQHDDWLLGINKHTCDLPDGIEYECCPDFSCCMPELAWPLEKRKAFVAAYKADRAELDSMSEDALNAITPENVLVLGVAGSVAAVQPTEH